MIRKMEGKIRSALSHYPKWYALVVGIGIVFFWRGVWHTADYVNILIDQFSSNSSTSLLSGSWWDGPFSFILGCIILYFTGAFTSSFIGNELILSGLRGEKKLSERAETDLKNEVTAISDIKDELSVISQELELLQKHAHENHKKM